MDNHILLGKEAKKSMWTWVFVWFVAAVILLVGVYHWAYADTMMDADEEADNVRS